jgi:uncharacterized membrane protein YuzA (DUF378 family)
MVKNDFQRLYLKKKFEMFTLLLVVVGALNWGLVGVFDFNLVAWLAKKTFASLENIVYGLVGLSALFHILSRDFYLPFLGDTVFPCDSMTTKVPLNADTQVKIETTPNTNVVYWAAESHKEVMDNPWVAYAENSNAGVVRSDVNGIAVLKFRKPAAYKVGVGGWKTVDPHVHYRVCAYPGMLSEIKTVYV